MGIGQAPPMGQYPPSGQMPIPPSAPSASISAAPTPSLGGYSWLQTTNFACGSLCHRAVVAGRDSDGSEIYVGRSLYQGDVIPAKVIPAKNAAYVPHNGMEIAVQNFELMVRSESNWVQSSNGNVPPGAYPVGYTSSGEVLYAGRVHAHGAITLGKVQPSHGCCYIPYGGSEESHKTYEVLVSS